MVTAEDAGEVSFRVYMPRASSMDVVGDFTGWRGAPIGMVPQEDGFWRVRVRVPPGEHSFAYLVNGETYLPDYAASGLRRNEFGGWVSCLVVPEARPAAVATEVGGARACAGCPRLGRRATSRVLDRGSLLMA